MNTPNESTPETPEKKSNDDLSKILEFLKDPSSKDLKKAAIDFLSKAVPHPLYRLCGDILIGGICFIAIIYCADQGFVDKTNVQSLLSLVVGAIVGSRFK